MEPSDSFPPPKKKKNQQLRADVWAPNGPFLSPNERLVAAEPHGEEPWGAGTRIRMRDVRTRCRDTLRPGCVNGKPREDAGTCSRRMGNPGRSNAGTHSTGTQSTRTHSTAGICNPAGVCTTRVLQPSAVLHWELQHRDAQCQDVHQRDVQCWDTQHRGAGHHEALHHLRGFSPLPPSQGKHLTGKEPRVRKRRGNPLIKAPNWALGDPAAFVPPPRARRRAAATTSTRRGPPGAPSPCSSRGGSPSLGRGQADRRAHCGAAAPAGKGLTPLVLIGGGG